MARGCTVQLLGAFRVTVDGRDVPAGAWRHRRGADLVKLLALAPGNRLHREQAMEALWPDLSPDAAAANLRKAVHFARRALGSEESVAIEGGMVMLWPEGELGVDLHRFEAAASDALRSNTPEAAESASSLFAGELLPEDLYASWSSEPRERARNRYVQLLKLARKWERVLDVDPSDEESHRELMRAHLEAGDRHAAIRQFERLREALRDELGITPDVATVELYEKVLAMEGHEPPTPEQQVRGLLAWGLVHWNRKELEEASRTASEARALALESGLGRELGEACALLGLVAHAQGRWREQFRAEFTEAIGRNAELASFVFDAHLCFAEFSLYGPEGHEGATFFATELLSEAERAGSIQGQGLAHLMLGEIELLSGRLDRAEQELAAALRLHAAAGYLSGEALSIERLAEASLARGRRWKAGRQLAKAKTLAERSALVSHLLVRVLGAVVQAAPDRSGSLAAVEKAEKFLSSREVCQPCSMGYRVAAAIACARAGELEHSRKHLDEAERIAGMWQGGPWLAAVWEARGVLRLASSEPKQAAALFHEAAEAFGTAGRPVDAERCREAAAKAG